MPISCVHCYHPVLTKDQVKAWMPEIAEELDQFQSREQVDMMNLMLDAKTAADQGLLPVFQELLANQMTEEEAQLRLAEYQQAQIQTQLESQMSAFLGQEASPSAMNHTSYPLTFNTPIETGGLINDPNYQMSMATANMAVTTPAEDDREPRGHAHRATTHTQSQLMNCSPIEEMEEEIDSGRSSNRSPSKSTKHDSSAMASADGDGKLSSIKMIVVTECKEESVDVDDVEEDELTETPQPDDIESKGLMLSEIVTSPEEQLTVSRKATPMFGTPKIKSFAKGMGTIEVDGFEEEEYSSEHITPQASTSTDSDSMDTIPQSPKPLSLHNHHSAGSPMTQKMERRSAGKMSSTPKLAISASERSPVARTYPTGDDSEDDDSEISTDSEMESDSDGGGAPSGANMRTQLSIIIDENELKRTRSRTIDPEPQSITATTSDPRRRWSSIDHDNRPSRIKQKVHAQTTRTPKRSFKFAGSRTVPYGAEADDYDDDELQQRGNKRSRGTPRKRYSAQLNGGGGAAPPFRHQRSGSAAHSAFQLNRDLGKSMGNLLINEQIKQSQQNQGKKRKKRKGSKKQRDSAMTEFTEIAQSIFEHRVESSGNLSVGLEDTISPRVFSPPNTKKKRKKKKKKKS